MTFVETISPTRRLSAPERKVFNRVVSEFVHLQVSDAEQLSQYAEAVVRYQTALKETKINPTVTAPVVNRSTGNVVADKIIRNPAFVTLIESQAQMNTLARRLLIDASSAEKRQRLLTKKARSLAAVEGKHSSDSAMLDGVSQEQIEAEIERIALLCPAASREAHLIDALWTLTVFNPMMASDPCSDPDISYMYNCPQQ